MWTTAGWDNAKRDASIRTTTGRDTAKWYSTVWTATRGSHAKRDTPIRDAIIIAHPTGFMAAQHLTRLFTNSWEIGRQYDPDTTGDSSGPQEAIGPWVTGYIDVP